MMPESSGLPRRGGFVAGFGGGGSGRSDDRSKGKGDAEVEAGGGGWITIVTDGSLAAGPADVSLDDAAGALEEALRHACASAVAIATAVAATTIPANRRRRIAAEGTC